VAKFTNVLMYDGKRSTAESIVYGAFDVIQERYKADPSTRSVKRSMP